MKSRALLVVATLLACVLLLITGCIKQEGFLENQTQSKNASLVKVVPPEAAFPKSEADKTSADQSSNESGVLNITFREEELHQSIVQEPENATPEEQPKNPNRIDAKKHSSGADITSDFDGVTKTFSVPDNDPDALVFDIAQELGKGIREIRPFVFINGQSYLKPSEQKKALEKVGQKETALFDASKISIMATKEEGFLRGVGCDLSQKYIRVDLTNPTENPVTIFKNKNTFPKVKSAMAIFLDRRPLTDMACSGGVYTFAPGDNFTCIKGNVAFIALGSRNLFETNASYDASQPDEVAITRPGYKESMPFYCHEKNETAVNET